MNHLEQWKVPPWFMAMLGSLAVEIFLLVVLGGSVRIHNAGLACPDWPLCFGDVIPDYHPQVYLEFLHRAFAGLVAIVTGILMFRLLPTRAPVGLKRLIFSAALLVLVQAFFGGLTVLHRLEAWVVTTHLGLGTGFFAVILMFYLRMKEPAPAGLSPKMRQWSVFVCASVFVQILLGGLVASNYAALVCTDFPTCHGQWFPTFQGIIGLHMIHRYGAYILFAIILANFIVMLNSKQPKRATKLAAWMFGLVC
jgi:cytochrome c oxidase assembly protein subunit 15